MFRKSQKYQEAVKLRKKARSLNEIAKSIGISKSTASLWCRNLNLPPKAKRIIEERIKRNKKFLVFCNKEKHKRVQAENKEIRESMASQISNLSERDLLLVGSALYWAEGYRKQEHLSSPYVCFSNSDPDMIKLFLRFLREVIKTPEEKLRAVVHIYPSINERSLS